MEGHVVSVERVIHAPAAAIFAVVADATRHPETDGSGTVIKPKPGAPQKLEMGSTFGMSMKMGVPYSMSNTVVEFEQDRRIAWRTAFPGFLGKFVGGRVWRYQFDPVDGGTKVTESWDISGDKQAFMMKRGGMAKGAEESMTKTLARLAEITEPKS
jgi:uncharacterized protein YndB with AHSA1/START domain